MISAVIAAKAWVITDGLESVVVNTVSDAISLYEQYNFKGDSGSENFRIIGISPWGMVQNRESLIKPMVRPLFLCFIISRMQDLVT